MRELPNLDLWKKSLSVELQLQQMAIDKIKRNLKSGLKKKRETILQSLPM